MPCLSKIAPQCLFVSLFANPSPLCLPAVLMAGAMLWGKSGNPAIGNVAAAESASQPPSDSKNVMEMSVIDFGETVAAGGSVVKGFCAHSGTDEIQACIWKVDSAAPGTSKPRIHIEF